MKKQWLVLMFAVILVFVTACSGKTSDSGNKTDTGSTGTAAKTTEAPKADTVTVWTYPVHAKYEDELKTLVADIQKKYPNLTVQTEVLSWAEGPKKFDVALNAGNPPDLYFHSVDGSYVDSGLVVELSKYITPDIKGDFLPGTLELAQIQGKQYGLPLYQFQWAWGGNKRILDEAGIDWKKIQKEGWTWTQFQEAAMKLTKKLPNGNMQYGLITDGNGANNDFIELLTRNNNIPDYTDKDGKNQFNDNRITDTLKFIQTLLKDGSMPKETAALDAKKRTEMFYAGQAAIISKAIPYYDVMIQNRNKDIDAGKVQGEKIDFVLLPVPHNDAAPAKTVMGAEGYVMFNQKQDKGEEHRKNVFKVMEELSAAKAGNAANELCLPFVRNSQVKEFAGKGLAKQENLDAANAMAKNMALPVGLNLTAETAAKVKQFRDQVVKPNMQALFAGEKTPEQVTDDFKNKGKQILGN